MPLNSSFGAHFLPSPLGEKVRARGLLFRFRAVLAFTIMFVTFAGEALCQGNPSFTLNGQAELDLKFDGLSGPGKHLRMEPDKTHILALRGAVGYRGYELPFSLFLTTDEKSFGQPRHRLKFGIDGQWFGVWVGDNNPDYTSLILRGLRVRGGRAFLEQGPIKIDVVHGRTQRSVEGKADMTGRILRYGTFERDLTAAQLTVKEIARVDFRFTVLRSKDDVSSIAYGRGPEKNTAFGMDFRADIVPRSMEFEAEIALSNWERSVTDRERGLGQESVKHTMKSALTAGLKGIQYGHRFSAVIQSVDTYFRSLGNPSLRPDKRGIKLSDDFRVLRNRLMLGFGYEWFRDNLVHDLPATRSTNIFTSRLSYTHSRLWPSLDFNFRVYGRGSDKDQKSQGAVDDEATSFGLALRYNATVRQIPYRLRAAYSYSKRDDKISPTSGNQSDNIALDLIATLAGGINLDLGYARTGTDFPGQDQSTAVNTFNFRGSSVHLSGGLLVFAGAKFVVSTGDVTTFKSNRRSFDIGCEYQVTKLLSARASYEHVDFNDDADDGDNYSERIFRFNLTYQFSAAR